MTIVVEDGTGKTNANSYVSVADADAYLAIKIGQNSAWNALVTGTKESYLEWATTLLDQRTRWSGFKSVQASALAWPRTGVIDREGFSVATNVVPTPVADAVVEIANYLVIKGNDPSIPNTNIANSGIKSLKADVLEITYNDGFIASIPSFPMGLVDILRPLGYFNGSGRMGFARVARS